ncbi:cytoglobin-1-like isoform X1 [Mercenaria mercenaria]|uniref:cytoglobin-1-like isoform X1 n=1 Tax=Mercenaria mercenaria TaxID=6596 RepID=UPI00234E56C8|nr:cytoglobin-1-like isoform X1 [Mercenaria mercenaria]
MGHSHGKLNVNSKIATDNTDNSNKKAFDPNSPVPELSENEVTMLKDMWKILNIHIAKVGTVMFADLFETHPEVQDVFMSFRTKDVSDLEYNKILRAHALRVMGTVDKCIYRLDNRDKLQDLMMALGMRHVNYSVKIQYIDLMGPQFISSIKPHLENMWTEEHERAWKNLFQLMCYYMKKGMCSI